MNHGKIHNINNMKTLSQFLNESMNPSYSLNEGVVEDILNKWDLIPSNLRNELNKIGFIKKYHSYNSLDASNLNSLFDDIKTYVNSKKSDDFGILVQLQNAIKAYESAKIVLDNQFKECEDIAVLVQAFLNAIRQLRGDRNALNFLHSSKMEFYVLFGKNVKHGGIISMIMKDMSNTLGYNEFINIMQKSCNNNGNVLSVVDKDELLFGLRK